MKYYILLIGVLLLISCTQEDTSYRIDVLYSHTDLMIQYSNESVLQKIGLQSEYFKPDAVLTAQEKAQILAQCYGTDNTNIGHLEEKMVVMMDEWASII